MTETLDRVSEVITHPGTLATTLAGVLAGLLGFLDPLWGLLSVTAGSWFSLAAVLGGTLLPEIGAGELGRRLIVLAALVYAAILLDKFSSRAAAYLEERGK